LQNSLQVGRDEIYAPRLVGKKNWWGHSYTIQITNLGDIGYIGDITAQL